MNRFQTLGLVFFTIFGVFSANAQSKIEPVREGGLHEAVNLSAENNIIVIYITGSKGKTGEPEPLTAKQYGERLVEGFKDPKYTKYPTDISVRYVETDDEGPTAGRVFINGQAYKTAKGFSLFTLAQIGSNIDLFTSKYAELKSTASDN